MRPKINFIVTMELPLAWTPAELKTYIETATNKWRHGSDPDGSIYDVSSPTVMYADRILSVIPDGLLPKRICNQLGLEK